MSDLIAFALTLGNQAQCNKSPVDALRLGLRGCIPESLCFICFRHWLFPVHSFISSSNARAPRHRAWYCDPAGLTESNLRPTTAQSWVRVDQLQQVFFYFQEWSFSYPHLRVCHRERKEEGRDGIWGRERVKNKGRRRKQPDNMERLAGPLQ